MTPTRSINSHRMTLLGLSLVAVLGALSGCASTTIDVTGQALQAPLCGRASAASASASVAVLWGPLWRPDQKEPPLREAAALKGLQQFFATQRCLTDVAIQRIAIPAQGELLSDAALLDMAKTLTPHANKVILIVVRELGPKLRIGLPTLVEGGTEVVVDVRVVDAQRQTREATVQTHWQKGGPFYVKGVKSLDQDMQAALASVFVAPFATSHPP
ncbi:hypothetical protein EV672_11123 [Aquabacterium commune]|uniref:DUF3313 domain-containing protein n=1 Tax=Aquabacterium commune TaxID=70586 RepID=A0A4V3CV19_9BURK|nr:hypothetical protein [Aquabacterium commune]TDP80688.1 hypothetical protein EV672_11123 [Aquabacterium commune]